MNALDDGMLLERWREQRDGEAFAELARRHSSVVFDLTCRVLGDRVGAEDVLQEALLSLALETSRKPADVGVVAWLARFAICRARNRRASERSRARRQIVVGLRRPEESMPDDGIALNDELEHALAGCDPEDRALLAMRFLHGWDYDRIAAALSIQEGAARVRVHRALQAVRGRVQAPEGNRVAPAIAALPIAALPAARIDAAIRMAVEVARVQLGAPPNGVEQATAASRSFRIAVTLTGAALLFVAVAGATAVPEFAGSSRDTAAADVAALDSGSRAPLLAAGSGAGRPAAVDAGFDASPRPPLWDEGALRRMARGESGDTTAAQRNAAPVAPEAAPPAVPNLVRGPAEGDVLPIQEPPNASRPSVRGACAAKGETASSDGERAGAFGGSGGTAAASVSTTPATVDDVSRAADIADAPAVIVVTTSAAPARHRASSSTASLDALPEETRTLVGQAEDLVRKVLEAKGAAGADDTAAMRQRIRDVRKHFAQLRREARGAAQGSSAKAVSAKRGAVIRQVLSLLAQVVLSDGRVAGDLRWPTGADVPAALAEVIRVLGTSQAPAPQELPAGAESGELPAGALPAGAAQ